MKNNKLFLRILFLAMCFPFLMCACGGDEGTKDLGSDSSSEKDDETVTKSDVNISDDSVTDGSVNDDSASDNSVADNSETSEQPGNSENEEANTIDTKKEVPYLAETVFETLDSVVVAADVTQYGADATGHKDSTRAFQHALETVGNAGGGTVWIPVGKYLITETLRIPALVTLRGDWNDPDGEDFNGNHGSIILAKPQSISSEKIGLFELAECSGVEKLTIYYPEQNINNVKVYSPTFYMDGWTRLRTIKDVTFINAYTGVYVEGINESTILRNVKGTCLNKGMEVHSSADVGVFDEVTFSPKYWANAGSNLERADRAAIVKYLRDHKSSGFLLHDLEQQQFSKIVVEGYEYGLFFSSEPTRFMASGPMYQVRISDCTYGIYAEGGTYVSPSGYAANICPILTSLDWRCGYIISNSSILGNEYSIYNGCPEVKAPDGNTYTAYIHLADVTLQGATYGNVTYTTAGKNLDLSKNEMQDYRKVKTTGTAFEAVKGGASEQEIQAALDKVGKAGGGVVYLPAGNYNISDGLTVPKNTEIVGVAGSAQRVPNKGTVLWCKQKGTTAEQRNAKAMITLAGDNSGISGLYCMYDKNIYAIDQQTPVKNYPFAVRGKGKGVWVVDCCIGGASHGIDFNNCDNHVIESLYSWCLYSHMEVSGDNGMVRNCLANATVIYRTNGVVPADEYTMQQNCFEKYGRPYSVYITVGEGTGEQLYNNFIYGGKHLLYIDGGQDINGVNMCSDALGSYAIAMDTGSAVITNAIITSVDTFYNRRGDIWIYNPLRNNIPDFSDYIDIQSYEEKRI